MRKMLSTRKTLGAFEKAPKPSKLLAGYFASLGARCFLFRGAGRNWTEPARVQRPRGLLKKSPHPKTFWRMLRILGGRETGRFFETDYSLNIYSTNGGCSVSSLTRSFKANNLSFSRTFCTRCIRFCQLLRSSRRRDIVPSTTLRAPSCSIRSR